MRIPLASIRREITSASNQESNGSQLIGQVSRPEDTTAQSTLAATAFGDFWAEGILVDRVRFDDYMV